MREFETIGYVLESVLTGLEMNARTREFLALILWPDIVGDSVARITSVQSAKNGVLYVDVESSAWAQELQYYKPDMLSRINHYIGQDAIREIHFSVRTIGKRRGRSAAPSPTKHPKGASPDVQLTLNECQEIEETAQKIGDSELRQAVTSTMASYRRLEHWMVLEGWKRCKGCQALYQRRRGCPFCAP